MSLDQIISICACPVDPYFTTENNLRGFKTRYRTTRAQMTETPWYPAAFHTNPPRLMHAKHPGPFIIHSHLWVEVDTLSVRIKINKMIALCALLYHDLHHPEQNLHGLRIRQSCSPLSICDHRSPCPEVL